MRALVAPDNSILIGAHWGHIRLRSVVSSPLVPCNHHGVDTISDLWGRRAHPARSTLGFMRLRQPTLSEWIVAVACGGWAVVFLLPQSGWAVPIALLWAVLVLVLPQRPIMVSITLVLVQTGLILAGETEGNPGALVTLLIAVYYLGRHAPLRWGAPVAALFLVEALADRSDAATVVFAAALLAGAYVFGRLVQMRAEAAARANRAEAALSGIDAGALAAEFVANERKRLGTQALEIIRGSVDTMRSEAVRAVDDLDPARIQSIVDRGGTAVTQLRRLLGVLRSP